MNKLIATFLLIISMSACTLHRRGVKCLEYLHIDTTTRVSIDTSISQSQTIIRIPGDTIAIHDTIKVECIDGKATIKPLAITIKKKGATSALTIGVGGDISVLTVCDSLQMVIDSLVFHINKNTEKNTVIALDCSEYKQSVDKWRFALFVVSIIFLLTTFMTKFK